MLEGGEEEEENSGMRKARFLVYWMTTTRWMSIFNLVTTMYLHSVSTSLTYTTTLTVASLTCTPSSFALSSCWNCLIWYSHEEKDVHGPWIKSDADSIWNDCDKVYFGYSYTGQCWQNTHIYGIQSFHEFLNITKTKLIHDLFQKHIHKVKIYPSDGNFTQALLVMHIIYYWNDM